MVRSQRKNFQFFSCHTSPCSQLYGLLSYGRPTLRKRLFRKATWTSLNSHKILVHLRLWGLNSNPSSFQRRWSMTSTACLMSVVRKFACWGWTWGPAIGHDAAIAEWDGPLCHQFIVWKSLKLPRHVGLTSFFCFADYEKTSEWGDAWVEKGEKVCLDAEQFFCVKANIITLYWLLSFLDMKTFQKIVFTNLQMGECNCFISLLQLVVRVIENRCLLNPFVTKKEAPMFIQSCRLSGVLA